MGGTVRVLPIDAKIDVADGESLFAAAQRLGFRWPTVCGGNCECGTCFMVVETGEENLSPMTDREQAAIAPGVRAREPRVRLACQVQVHGSATVTRRGVRPSNGMSGSGAG